MKNGKRGKRVNSYATSSTVMTDFRCTWECNKNARATVGEVNELTRIDVINFSNLRDNDFKTIRSPNSLKTVCYYFIYVLRQNLPYVSRV